MSDEERSFYLATIARLDAEIIGLKALVQGLQITMREEMAALRKTIEAAVQPRSVLDVIQRSGL